VNQYYLQADYVTVVENRPKMFVKYCLQVPVFHFWQNWRTLQRGLSEMAELLISWAIHWHSWSGVLKSTEFYNRSCCGNC